MVKIYYKNIKEKELKTLDEFKVGSWVHAENPTEAEIEKIVAMVGVDASLLKDALDTYEAPRLEIEKDITYIFTRFCYNTKQGHIVTSPILLVIGEYFLLTVCEQPFPSLEKFISGGISFYTTQKTKLFLQVFFQINLTYNVFLHSMSKTIRGISIQLEKINNKDILQFVSFENVLNDFLSALVPTNTILETLLSGKYLRLYEEDKDLIEDLFLNNGQLIKICDTNLKTIVNIRESYSTILTNNLNRVIRLLTAVTVLLTIPTMISSLFGMNVPVPFADSPTAFRDITLSLLAIVTGLLFLFIKNRWL